MLLLWHQLVILCCPFVCAKTQSGILNQFSVTVWQTHERQKQSFSVVDEFGCSVAQMRSVHPDGFAKGLVEDIFEMLDDFEK